MKTLKLSAIAAVLLLGASLSVVVQAQSTSTKRPGPDTLVADLYKANKQKRSPFFQTRSRALLYKYFEKTLADLIWKDAVHSKGEVGAIDGDPLYDAQDMEIKKFAIKKPRYEEGRALVDAQGFRHQGTGVDAHQPWEDRSDVRNAQARLLHE